MVGLRKRALSAVLGAASLCAATPAGAMIVVTVTPGGAGGVAFGTIDLSAYLRSARPPCRPGPIPTRTMDRS
jgi:hypothetical protein